MNSSEKSIYLVSSCVDCLKNNFVENSIFALIRQSLEYLEDILKVIKNYK